MSLFSGFGYALASVCSAVGNFIGGSIGVVTSKIGQLLHPFIDPFKVIEIVCKIVRAVSDALGLTQPEESVEELGAKASQPETKKSTEFESTEDYIKYLREEIELDKKRFEGLSKEEKAACKLAGTMIVVKGIEEKTGVSLPPEFLVDMTKINLKHDELSTYIDSFKMNGITDMRVMTDYLSGKCDLDKVDQASTAVVKGLMALNPTMDLQEVQDKLIEMKEAARQ